MKAPTLLALLLALAAHIPVHAAVPTKVSVVDFFHLLCDTNKLDIIITDRAKLLDTKKGAVIDLSNGYLHTHGDGAQPAYTLALFRRPDQSPVFVIVDHGADPFFEDIKIYALDPQGKPADITEKAWPLKRPKDGTNGPVTRYYLPRYGRTIAVVVQPENLSPVHNHLASVAWVKGRFVVEPDH